MKQIMKTIFITGGASGIGRACVEKFAAEGWRVAFMDLDDERAKWATALPGVLFVHGDTRRREDIHAAVAEAVSRFGSIDSVFVNAGIHRNNNLLTISDEELRMMIDINIYGSVNTLREAVPEIIRAGGGTVVINCSDQWFIGKPNSFAYGLTKGALGQITRSLSIDLGPKGVRVNAICPGTIETPLMDGALRRSSEKSGVPLQELYEEENGAYYRGRVGQPSEVAELVYFLASDKSSFCTGGHYIIDGGLVAK